MLRLSDSWVWDSWLVDTGNEYHVFFLYASRALNDPELRHRRAGIGHAVSADLRAWHRLTDVVVRGDAGSVDEVATWTGSTVRGDDGAWWLFYTAVSDAPSPTTQRVAAARSADLLTWHKVDGLVVEADGRWYQTPLDGSSDLAWRDPWVFRVDGSWQMLVTAHAADGAPPEERGVVGRAVSQDMRAWEVLPPATVPGKGFTHLEVTHTVEIDGRWWLVFSCGGSHLAGRFSGQEGGMWMAPAEGPSGPFDLDAAHRITGEDLYAGHVFVDRDGQAKLLAFRNVVDGEFVGELIDPVPLSDLVAPIG